MRSESESLSFLARPNLNSYTGRSQATTMSKPDKTFPLLILPVLPSLHNPGVGPYEFRLSDCLHNLEWLYLSWVQVVKDDKPVLYMRGQSFCSHLNQLSHHLRPSPKPGSPWSSLLKGDKGENPSSYTFWKAFSFENSHFSQIICNKYIKDWLRQAAGWP